MNDILFKRAIKNKERLNSPEYKYPGVFNNASEWPGDWEGRCLLSLVSLINFFSEDKEIREELINQTKEIVDHLDDYINEDGYFGDIFNEKYVNEQQVSGNSWFLRGLVEYYKITNDNKVLKIIDKIIKNFILPINPFYNKYPKNQRERGRVDGTLIKNVENGWMTSTDIGCAFIMLDGMVSVYSIKNSIELYDAIANIIEIFIKLDFIKLNCQTHATLSCCRAILSFYQITKCEKYLKYSIDIFELYKKYGMTFDFGNINWFGRNDSWTEPCCIVDSIILCYNLFKETKNDSYISLLNKIYETSIPMSQRSNGGAGCNTCLIGENFESKIVIYEAYFCCTMRLAEGLLYLNKSRYEEMDDNLYLLIPSSSIVNNKNIKYELENNIYSDGKLDLKIDYNLYKNIYLYIPQSLKVNIKGIKPIFEGTFLKIHKGFTGEIAIFYELIPQKNGVINSVGDRILFRRNDNIRGFKKFKIGINNYYYSLNYIDINKDKALELKEEL